MLTLRSWIPKEIEQSKKMKLGISTPYRRKRERLSCDVTRVVRRRLVGHAAVRSVRAKYCFSKDRDSKIRKASVAALLAVAQPASGSAWHAPCGQPLELSPPTAPGGGERRVSLERQLAHSLSKISRLITDAISSFKQQGFDQRYEHYGITDEQLSASWLPGEGDVNVLVETYNKTRQVPLKNLHVDLQLFSAAFEQMIQEETDPENKLALSKTDTNNLELLCEVETLLVSLEMGVPARVQGAGQEQQPAVGVTAREVRQWAGLLRYRHYLRGWARLLRLRPRHQRRQRQPAESQAPPAASR